MTWLVDGLLVAGYLLMLAWGVWWGFRKVFDWLDGAVRGAKRDR